MFSTHKPVSNQQVKSLIATLHEVKNIVYYSLCLPIQFAAWMDEGEVSAEDRLTMQNISDQISKSLFFMDVSSKLEVISEDKVIDVHRSLFVISIQLKYELEKWRVSLQNWQPAAESLVVARATLMSGIVELNSYIDMRETMLNSHCNWRSLPPDKNDQLTEARKKVEGLKKAQQFVVNMMLPLMSADQHAVIPLYKHMSLMQRGEDLIARQLELEHQIHNRTVLERFQHAIISLNSAENEECDKWLFDALMNNSRFRDAISYNVSKLVKLQTKLNDFLEQRSRADHALSKKLVQFGMDCLVMTIAKDVAKEAYQKRVESELASNQEAFFNERATMGQQYREALNNYERENYKVALQGFLQGVLKMHAPSLRQAGEMILQGQGCSVDAAIASELMLIAYGLEDMKVHRISLLTSMYTADALITAENLTLVRDNVNHSLGVNLMTDIEIVKKIYFMKTSVAERLFRLGEALILMIIVREAISDKNTASFMRACYFFEYAYKYVKGAYERKAIMKLSASDYDERIRLSNECLELEKKMQQYQKDIKEQFSYMDGDVYCKAAPAMIAEFYKRFEFETPAAPRLAAGLKA